MPVMLPRLTPERFSQSSNEVPSAAFCTDTSFDRSLSS